MAVLGLLSLIVPLLILGAIVFGVVVLVNKRKPGSGGSDVAARDVLLYLLATATLYLSVLGVLLVIWSLADYWFPEYPGARTGALQDGPMRGGIAMALVAFPVFVGLNIYTKKRESEQTKGMRLLFVYVNLFIVTLTVMVDLMVVVNGYLNGDLTPRFVIRAAGVLVMAGLIYLYYRNDSSRNEGLEPLGAGQPEPQT